MEGEEEGDYSQTNLDAEEGGDLQLHRWSGARGRSGGGGRRAHHIDAGGE